MKKRINQGAKKLGQLIKRRAEFYLSAANFTQEEQLLNLVLTGERYRDSLPYALRELKIAFNIWRATFLSKLASKLEQ